MSRIIQKDKTGPIQIDTDGTPIFICGCGLTRNENGVCDGSHNKTKDEEDGKVYVYNNKLEREEVCSKCGKTDCKCEKKEEESCSCDSSCGCGDLSD